MERSGFVGLCEEIIGTHVWVVAGIQKLGWVKPCHPLEITNCWRPTKMSIDGIKEPQAGYRTRPWVTPEHFYCYRYRWPQIENSIIWPDQRCFCVIRSESWETELKQRELDIIFNVLCSCRTRQRYTWRPTRTDLWKHRGKRIGDSPPTSKASPRYAAHPISAQFSTTTASSSLWKLMTFGYTVAERFHSTFFCI